MSIVLLDFCTILEIIAPILGFLLEPFDSTKSQVSWENFFLWTNKESL